MGVHVVMVLQHFIQKAHKNLAKISFALTILSHETFIWDFIKEDIKTV